MAITIRLSRQGRKKLPYYAIVVADSRSARDGRFIEKVGSYNPLLNKDDAKRVVLNSDRIKHWLGQGAQTSERVGSFLGKAGLIAMPAQRVSIEKAKPKAKAVERAREKAEKAEARAAAEAEAKNAPAPAPEPEVVAEAAPEAPAEETAA